MKSAVSELGAQMFEQIPTFNRAFSGLERVWWDEETIKLSAEAFTVRSISRKSEPPALC